MGTSELEAQLALGTIKFYEDGSDLSFTNDDIRWIIPKLSAKGLTYLLSTKQVYYERYGGTMNDLVMSKKFNYTHALLLARRKNVYIYGYPSRVLAVLNRALLSAIREGKIGVVK